VELEGKLKVGRLSKFTSVQALESVGTLSIELSTEVEAVSSTESFGDHGRLQDLEWIVGIFSGVVVTSGSEFSLTDDISLGSVTWDFVWKGPVDFESVDERKFLSLDTGGSKSIESSSNTAVGLVGGTEIITLFLTIDGGVDTNTSSDFSGIVGVFTERNETGSLRSGFTSWSGDGELVSELGSGGVDVVGIRVSKPSINGGTGDDLVGWELDGDLELHFESRVISRSKVLSDFNDEGSVNNRALWSLVGHGNSWDFVISVSIINTKLGVSTGGDPGPVIVGNWVFLPSVGGSNLSSGTTSTKLHNDVIRSLDNFSGSPVGHGDGPFDLSGFTWIFLLTSSWDDLGSSKDHSWSSDIDVDRIEDSVTISDWTSHSVTHISTSGSSSEVVHSGFDGDWGESTGDGTGTWHGETIRDTLRELRGKLTLEVWRAPVASTLVDRGGWWVERSGEWPSVWERRGGSGWNVSRDHSDGHVSLWRKVTIESEVDGKGRGSTGLWAVPSRLCYTVDSTRHSNANDGNE
jgi:hypothetical protein